jgi:hypothetical protein
VAPRLEACSRRVHESSMAGLVRRHCLIPDNPFGRHSGEGRNPVNKNTPRSGQNLGVVPLAWDISIIWIPACAGMTAFRSNGLFGLMRPSWISCQARNDGFSVKRTLSRHTGQSRYTPLLHTGESRYLEGYWIPGQARNDEATEYAELPKLQPLVREISWNSHGFGRLIA